MRPDPEAPVVRKMKSDRERDGKRAPGRKRRDQQRKFQRQVKRSVVSRSIRHTR